MGAALELTFNSKMQCCPRFFLRCTGQPCCLNVSADATDTIAECLLPEPKTALIGMEMLAQLVTDEVTSKQVGHGCWADAPLASLPKLGAGGAGLQSMGSGGSCSVGRPRNQRFERAGCSMKCMPSALLQWHSAALTAAVCNIATQLPARCHEVWQQPQLKADALLS